MLIVDLLVTGNLCDAVQHIDAMTCALVNLFLVAFIPFLQHHNFVERKQCCHQDFQVLVKAYLVIKKKILMPFCWSLTKVVTYFFFL